MLRAVDRAEALCNEAGSDRGLYLLAFAHEALATHLEHEEGITAYLASARALEDYLAAHPIEAMSSPLERDRVEQLRRSVHQQLAWVRVVSRPNAVVVRVADVRFDDAEVPFAPGVVTFAVTAPQHELPADLTLTLAAGSDTALALVEDDVTPTPEGARRIVLRRRVPPPPPPPPEIVTVVPPDEARPVEVTLPRPAIDTTPRPLRPWAIAATTAAGAFALAGVGLAVWWSDQTATYDAQGCASRGGATCGADYDRIVTTNTLFTTAFITAGAFAIGAATLWSLDRRDATHARRRTATLGCAAALGGLRCTW